MKPLLCDLNQTTQPIREHKMFNNWETVARGWYVVGKSQELKKGKTYDRHHHENASRICPGVPPHANYLAP